MKEIEAKFKLDDASLIDSLNLNPVKSVEVLDIYFNNEALNFKAQDKVLRLRRENGRCQIAYKGAREKHDNLIVRDEFESEINSFDKALKIIEGLGFYPTAKVEKKRSYFETDDYSSLSITFDEYPFIGAYLEVEGDEPEVLAFLQKYDFNLNQTIQKNCTELFLDHCQDYNLNFDNPQAHFTFEDEMSLRE